MKKYFLVGAAVLVLLAVGIVLWVNYANKSPTSPRAESEILVHRLESFPRNGLVATTGSLVYEVSVENTTQKQAAQILEWKLDGQTSKREDVILQAGEHRMLRLVFDGEKPPGDHRVEIGGKTATFQAIAIPPSERGELPPDPLILGPDDGLTELGKPGGKVVATWYSPPTTLNPYLSNDSATDAFIGQMHSSLLGWNPFTKQYEPGLAASWEISADNTQIIFHLRRGVKFSDGVPFTADDVLFTFNDVIFNPDVTTDRELLTVNGKPIQVEKLDDFTIKVKTPAPFRPILDSLSGAVILPKHKLAHLVRTQNPNAAPDAFNQAWPTSTKPEELAGLGPFVLKEYIPNQRAVYERNLYYWGADENGAQLTYLDELVILIVPEYEQRVAKFQSGETDGFRPTPEDWSWVIQQADQKGWRPIRDGASYGYLILTFNQDTKNPVLREVFRNLKFRQAIAYAMDQEKVVQEVSHGFAFPQWSPVDLPSPYYD